MVFARRVAIEHVLAFHDLLLNWVHPHSSPSRWMASWIGEYDRVNTHRSVSVASSGDSGQPQ